MTKTYILLRLLFVLVLSAGSIILFWVALAPLSGLFLMAPEAKAILVILHLLFSLFLLILSLPALLLSRASVRFSVKKRFMAFMGPSLLAFVFMLVLFVMDRTERTVVTDFFIAGLPAMVHALWMYYVYRKIIANIENQAPMGSGS
ncbi:MAG: hypothetical protein JST26_07325 [Bacteroidetes bacterium]|nr:hypothetical protein [Bacteroidota bacterium]